jgi:hydroxyacylglutathione hydrolase
MIVKRFYDDKLAQASYLIGCPATGEAVVVDANRDTAQYVAAAEAEELEITHVTETHIHADFISGSRELAHRTGARLYLSAEGGAEWQYGFARDEARPLRDGDGIEVGNVRLEAVHTPGHTPEHLTFLVTDGAASDRPIGALTGDFLFVGDVGRPDLLEKAAGVGGAAAEGARSLFRSLQRFRDAHPSWLQIWPGHGAGSACGKGIGAIPQSTLGYEALTNWAFSYDDEDAFVRAALDGQPEPPRYFGEMKRLNRDGPRILGGFERPPRLPAARLEELRREGALVVDTRSADAFATRHVPDTLNIPVTRAFTTWAGWLVPYDRDFYLIGDDSELGEAVRDLAMIGLDRVAGVFASDVVDAWSADPDRDTEAIEIADADRVARARNADDVTILDIRGETEWESVRIPGALHIPLGYLPDRVDEIPGGRPVVVHCESGSRSPIAASVLQAAGVKRVLDFRGGIREWTDRGLETESGLERAAAGEPASVQARG